MISRKLTAIAIDDEEAALQSLTRVLESYFKDKVELIDTSRLFDEGIILAERIRPDVIFLDIDIEFNRSGFDFLKVLRSKNTHSQVVFITAHEQFGVKALRAAAFDYLVKPVDKDDLKNVIERLNETKPKKDRDFILVNNKEALHKILLDDILYIAAEGSYVEIFIENKSRPILTSYNLAVIEEEINQLTDKFYRIHKSYLVNREKIVTVKKQLTSKKIVLSNDAELPISRSKYNEFIAIFTNL